MRTTRATETVLRALLDAPASGTYGLEISKATGIGAGTLYPLLDRFESAGWIIGEWEVEPPEGLLRPRRRYYRLTGPGEVEANRVIAEAIRRLTPPGWQQPVAGWST